MFSVNEPCKECNGGGECRAELSGLLCVSFTASPAGDRIPRERGTVLFCGYVGREDLAGDGTLSGIFICECGSAAVVSNGGGRAFAHAPLDIFLTSWLYSVLWPGRRASFARFPILAGSEKTSTMSVADSWAAGGLATTIDRDDGRRPSEGRLDSTTWEDPFAGLMANRGSVVRCQPHGRMVCLHRNGGKVRTTRIDRGDCDP